MNYQESLAYLDELNVFGVNLGLARIQRLMFLLGDPQKEYKTIHVTGTNGKGSVTAMLASCLQAAVLGIWILIKSSIRLQYVFFLKDSGSEEWIKAMIVNILTLILGMVLIFNPFKGAETIMRIIGIFMIIYAILDISEYYMTKPKKVKVIK